MKTSLTAGLSALALAAMWTSTANAASVYLVPGFQYAFENTTVVLDLHMDFTGEPTIGGAVDVTLSGPITLENFTPSAFLQAADPVFSGYGTEFAGSGAALEVHIGNFAGVEGAHHLGTLSIFLAGAGLGHVGLAANTILGSFMDLEGSLDPMNVDFAGAEINISAVPLPATVWMLLTGVGALVARRAASRR